MLVQNFDSNLRSVVNGHKLSQQNVMLHHCTCTFEAQQEAACNTSKCVQKGFTWLDACAICHTRLVGP